MDKRVKFPSSEVRDDWIPRDEYIGPDVAQNEKDFLWPFVWQIACRETELKNVGDYIVYDILDDTMMVVRTGEGPDDFYAAYNVCQHRGRKLLTEPRGNLGSRILCKFHGWQYDLEGRLVHVPFEKDFDGCPAFADAKQQGLSKVKLARWGGWIWINQDQNAEPLEEHLGIIPEMVDPFEPENMRAVWNKTLIAPVNWKTILEAFNESYHAIATHTTGMIYNMNSPAAMYGKHGNYYFEQLTEGMEGASTAGTRYRKSNGKWTTAKSIAESI